MNEPIGNVILGLALGWLTLALAVIVYFAARRAWRRWRYGAPLDHSALLMGYGRKLTGALDRKALAQLLTIELPHALHVERVALLFPEAFQLVAAGRDELRLPTATRLCAGWPRAGKRRDQTRADCTS